MALNGCEPCCDPSVWARSQDTYRDAVLRTLCNLITAVNTLEVTVTPAPSPANATVTAVPVSLVDVIALASNPARLGAFFYNDSDQPVYLKFGSAATPALFTLKLESKGYYEVPQPNYSGDIHAIWTSGTGSLMVTELT